MYFLGPNKGQSIFYKVGEAGGISWTVIDNLHDPCSH